MRIILSVILVVWLGTLVCCQNDDPIKKINFNLSVYTFNPTSENFELSTSDLVVTSEEKVLTERAVPAAVTKIKVRETDIYTLTISKPGYISSVRSFTLNELKAYAEQPFYVRLYEESTTFNLAVYYPFSGNTEDASGHYSAAVNIRADTVPDRYGNFNSAYSFDGFTQYMDMGNILDDITYPFTVSVWVKPADHTGRLYNTIFTAQDNSPLYNGFEIHINHGTSVGIGIGDGRGENNGAYSRFKSSTIENKTGSWTHVAAVVKGNDDMTLYVNGIDVGGAYGGSTSFPINSNFPSDVARMGRWTSNGNTYYYTGVIDEFKVWKRALTPSQLKAAM